MNGDTNKPKKPLRFWPGMPTPASKRFELFFPCLLPFFALALVSLILLVQSCRYWLGGRAGQAPPLSDVNAVDAEPDARAH